MTFPLKQVTRIDSIARSAAIKKTPASKTEDQIQLANGDSVTGVIEALTPAAEPAQTGAGADADGA